jgi:predicted DNA-binding protein (MmcQ/YjbR family)
MHPTTKPSAHTEKQVQVLRAHALAYPESHEDFPWGHSAFKVRTKAFAFLHADGDGFSISVKLPESNALALSLPFAEPTGYGLGKSGWISARFGKQDDAPLTMLKSWLEESYSAIAPKRLLQTWLAAGDPVSRAGRAKPGARGAVKAAAKPSPTKKAATQPAAKRSASGKAAKPTPGKKASATAAKPASKKAASAQATRKNAAKARR